MIAFHIWFSFAVLEVYLSAYVLFASAGAGTLAIIVYSSTIYDRWSPGRRATTTVLPNDSSPVALETLLEKAAAQSRKHGYLPEELAEELRRGLEREEPLDAPKVGTIHRQREAMLYLIKTEETRSSGRSK